MEQSRQTEHNTCQGVRAGSAELSAASFKKRAHLQRFATGTHPKHFVDSALPRQSFSSSLRSRTHLFQGIPIAFQRTKPSLHQSKNQRWPPPPTSSLLTPNFKPPPSKRLTKSTPSSLPLSKSRPLAKHLPPRDTPSPSPRLELMPSISSSRSSPRVPPSTIPPLSPWYANRHLKSPTKHERS